jgi:hypothetical protein
MARGYYNRSDSFSLQLAAFAAKAGKNADTAVRKTIIDVGTRLVELSPVGDGDLWKSPPPPGYVGGRFRANWQGGNNSVPSNELPDIDPSPAESNVSTMRIIGAIPERVAGGNFIITNNLPYGQRLEDGWSTQAPAGMVHITVIEFQQIVAGAAQGLA